MLHGSGPTHGISPLLGVHRLSERQLAAVLFGVCAANDQAGLNSACIIQTFPSKSTVETKPYLYFVPCGWNGRSCCGQTDPKDPLNACKPAQ